MKYGHYDPEQNAGDSPPDVGYDQTRLRDPDESVAAETEMIDHHVDHEARQQPMVETIPAWYQQVRSADGKRLHAARPRYQRVARGRCNLKWRIAVCRFRLAQVQKRKLESRWRPLLEHCTRSIPVYRDDRIAEAVNWWQFFGDISGQRDVNFILLARRLKSAGCDSGEFASLMTRPAAS